ncbi:D-Ala-D-Ala carboxypeptidase family metallohydrolase [Microvirga pudoricolor]|uniref:D-Ala-D-Ala carboxypeptidase family metallohydrolase n=1 Tax=Microvirga pudoricolor TaxID=2778729 RepID=UPI00194E6C61|nr:D-Ala-D-Ala carboxypeptidase family metallohydrolase [Microvirga pudoricolor]MBM6592816.1 hypothetical protein [Microvirga pudoricolor]
MSIQASRLGVVAAALAILLPVSRTGAETDPDLPSRYANLPAATVREAGRQAPSGVPALVAKGFVQLRSGAPLRCVPGGLLAVVAGLSARFGTVSVESTHRSRGRNGRAGGARQSLHLACRAVDFRVRARASGVMGYLRSRPEVGGLKLYRNGIIHIDDGKRRSW